MSEDDKSVRVDRRRKRVFLGLVATVLTGGLIVLMALFHNLFYERRIGLEQPVAFSHRVHATDKQISCFMCHTGTTAGRHAGIPPLETCMLCHQNIITTHPQIQIVKQNYDAGQPIPWESVYKLQEFVFFDHQAHVGRRVDCGECHGNIKAMDRVAPVNEFTMGFCVQCHRDNSASTDCLTCHR